MTSPWEVSKSIYSRSLFPRGGGGGGLIRQSVIRTAVHGRNYSSWQYIYRNEWRALIRQDYQLKEAIEILGHSGIAQIDGLIRRYFDELASLIDRIYYNCTSAQFEYYKERLATSHLIKNLRQESQKAFNCAGVYIRPAVKGLEDIFIIPPTENVINTLREKNNTRNKKEVNLKLEEEKVKDDSEHSHSKLPIKSNLSLSRRWLMDLRYNWILLRKSVQAWNIPLVSALLSEPDMSLALRILRREFNLPSLDVCMMTDLINNYLLPDFMSAASKPIENSIWLNKHCSPTVVGTINAVREAEKDAFMGSEGEVDDVRYVSVTKLEFKGVHVPWKLRVKEELGDISDDNSDQYNIDDDNDHNIDEQNITVETNIGELPSFIYLVGFRLVSLKDQQPRDMIVSMAVSLRLVENGVDQLPFEIKEMSILGNETLKW